jgi:hypothetical protein
MKKLSFLLLATLPLFAIGKYKTNDILYNWKVGLVNIRLKPNPESIMLMQISFGEPCVVVDNAIKTHPFAVQEIAPENKTDAYQIPFQGYAINGFWVQVKTKLGTIGYVFDGYLSKLKPDFELTTAFLI